MESIFQNYIIEKPKQRSERAEIISQIYSFYIDDKQNRKKSNWKRYCQWCRDNKKPKGSEKEFMRTKFFIKEYNVKTIAFKLSHIPTPDLFFVLSKVKDKFNRGENVGGYLLGSVKPE